MADYDFLTLKQRMDVLRHIQHELELAIRAAREAQKQYDVRTRNDFFVNVAAINGAVQGALNLSRDHALRAKGELDSLLTTYTGVDTNTYYPNFIQKYRAEVGLAGVAGIAFSASNKRITPFRDPGATGITGFFGNGGKPTSHANNIWNEDDLVIVSGTKDNDGIYTVDAPNSASQYLAVDEALVNENCVAKGAFVMAIRRSI